MRRVLTFYKFLELPEPEAERAVLLAAGERLQVKGTILLAGEGVNGTLVGETRALEEMAALLEKRYGELPCKWSELDETNSGFYRYKVKVKPEIVSFGVADLDVTRTGEHVDAARWNELLADPRVVVVDTRNQYEVDIGTFPGAVSPATASFREFPGWVAEALDPAVQPSVAMFCTGGIRCEKASAYLLQQGFERVYQLDGGILRYLETVSEDANRWEGECFVFDQRVSVTRDLAQGHYQQCFACRHPLSAEDLESEHYEPGVSCPHCRGGHDDARRANLRERQRQVRLADARGEQHIGVPQHGARH